MQMQIQMLVASVQHQITNTCSFSCCWHSMAGLSTIPIHLALASALKQPISH